MSIMLIQISAITSEADRLAQDPSRRTASPHFGSRLVVILTSWTFATLLAGCLANAQVEYKRTIVEPADVIGAIDVAEELDSRQSEEAPAGKEWLEVRKGTLPAIVTVPHSTDHFRLGKYKKYKMSDGGGTAGLAVALHRICDVTIIYTTYASPSDPNYYDDNEFKEILGRLIDELNPVVLLDVHASHPYRPYEVDLGTMNGQSVLGDDLLVPSLVDALRNEGLQSISVDRFPASKNQTVTKYAAGKGVPAVQLEFSSTRTNPFRSTQTDRKVDALAAHRFAQAIQALAEFLGKRGLCARINDMNLN